MSIITAPGRLQSHLNCLYVVSPTCRRTQDRLTLSNLLTRQAGPQPPQQPGLQLAG